jgi:omega-amidase
LSNKQAKAVDIVAVQLDIQWERKSSNHQRVGDLLQTVCVEPGSLIILPEMFDTGFSMNLGRTAQTDQRESEHFLKELAIQYRSTVLGGVVSPIVEGRAGNEAVAFSPEGQLLARYRKQRPFSLVGEADHYPAGSESVIFQCNGVSVAPFICYDLRFPELFRPSVFQGAELLAVIACWPAVRSEHWVRLLQARAIENLAFTVGVNRCGEEPNLKFDGRSCVFDHMGHQLLQASNEPQILQCSVDIEAMRTWRRKFPALRDATSSPSLQQLS